YSPQTIEKSGSIAPSPSRRSLFSDRLLGRHSPKMLQCAQILAKLRVSNTLQSDFSSNHHQN
ncbi:MAG: hypothetical protein ACRESZ_17290, partial [Methylococcales bacterium]